MAANANKPGSAQMESNLMDADQIMTDASRACDECEFYERQKTHRL